MTQRKPARNARTSAAWKPRKPRRSAKSAILRKKKLLRSKLRTLVFSRRAAGSKPPLCFLGGEGWGRVKSRRRSDDNIRRVACLAKLHMSNAARANGRRFCFDEVSVGAYLELTDSGVFQ